LTFQNPTWPTGKNAILRNEANKSFVINRRKPSVVIVFLVWRGGNALTRRLISIHSEAREEINGGLRLSIDRDCLRMLVKRPLLGWGLSAFPTVYPEFRSFYTNFFVNPDT
jgi:O-antigen ligase